MAARGYTTVNAVALFLGITLTTNQTAQATALLQPAEDVVDAIANTSWLNGAITGEQYDLMNRGVRIYLRQNPVASVQGVTVRSLLPGDTGQVLVAGQDYELLDLTAGLLVLSGVWSAAAYYSTYQNYGGSAIYNESGAVINQGQCSGQIALVSYTPVQVVPAVVSLAACELVAFWLKYNINPAAYGIASMRTADQQIVLSTALAQGVIPAGVVDMLQRSVATVLL